MAKYTTELHYSFSGETDDGDTKFDFVVTHDSYESAIGFQTQVINPAIDTINAKLTEAGMAAISPQGKITGKSA